jgi:predicted unusual protein kinase regulating ubiquinone biosynthesis (AarF/ABC1/UbiB family)
MNYPNSAYFLIVLFFLNYVPSLAIQSAQSQTQELPSLSAEERSLEQDAQILKLLARDLVDSTGEPSPEVRASKVKKALAEHPEVLSWPFSKKDVNAIIKKADFPELPEAFKESLSVLYTFANPLMSIQHDILRRDGMNLDQISFSQLSNIPKSTIIKNLIRLEAAFSTTQLLGLNKIALYNLLQIESAKLAYRKFLTLSPEQRLRYLKKVPDDAVNPLSFTLENQLKKIKFSETPALKMLKDPQSGFDMSQAPKKLADLFDTVITKYFDEIPYEDKKGIIVGLIELPPSSSDVKKLSTFLHRSGPVLQKLFQLFGKDVKSPFVAEVMGELKSGIRPFDGNQAIKIIEQNTGKKITDIFSDFKISPLAAASVGQVHLAKLKGSNREVIVKILRPGIEAKAKRELDTLKSLAPDAGSKKIIERLEETLMEELDFRLEAGSLKDGLVYEHPELGILPVKLISDIPSVFKNVLIMEKAPGKTFDKNLAQDLDQKTQVMKDFLNVWFDEAIFGKGFFHGDLHPGNLFFYSLDTENEEPKKFHSKMKTSYLLTPIDFGSVGTLTRQEQKALLKLAFGSIFGSSMAVIDSFSAFHHFTQREMNQFKPFVEEQIKNPLATAFDIMNSILNKAIEMNLTIPKNFVLFNRGRMFLEKQVDDINKKIQEEYEQYPGLKPIDSQEIYRQLAIKRLSADYIKRLIGVQSDETSLVDGKLIHAMVEDYLKPNAPYFKKQAVQCLKRGTYQFSYEFLKYMSDAFSFLDPVPQARLQYPNY